MWLNHSYSYRGHQVVQEWSTSKSIEKDTTLTAALQNSGILKCIRQQEAQMSKLIEPIG